MPLQVIVVGAGIGGLITAIALRQAGHSVTVLERHPEKSEVGFALEIPPNSSRILKKLGLDLSMVRGCRQFGVDIFDAEPPTISWKFSEERPNEDDAPCITVHRQDFFEVLKNMATREDGSGPPVKLKLGCHVVSYDVEKGLVVLRSGETYTADLLVAADGVHSLAHHWVIGEQRLPHFTGITNIRFLLTTDQVLRCPGMEALVNKGRACVYSVPKGSTIMHYPCRDGTLQNFGIYYIDPNTHADRSHSQISLKDLASERVSKMNQSIKSLVNLAKEEDFYLWRIVERDPLPRMYKGKLVLVGDANHPMRTAMGQGAAQATEDAVALGILMQHVRSEADVRDRLQAWENIRKPRASAIQLMSRTSPTTRGWPNPEDQHKAQEYFPQGDLPLTRAEMVAFAHTYNVADAAKEALAKLERGRSLL